MIGELIEGGVIIGAIVIAAPSLRLALNAYVNIRVQERVALMQRKLDDEALKAARETAAIESLPVTLKRENDIEDLVHRDRVARATARAVVSEANVELLKQRAQKALESGEPVILALPPPLEGPTTAAETAATWTEPREYPWLRRQSAFLDPLVIEAINETQSRARGFAP